MGKTFWKSKTLWVNFLTLASVILMSAEIEKLVNPITIVKIQAGVNIGLRIITSTSLSFWNGGNA